MGAPERERTHEGLWVFSSGVWSRQGASGSSVCQASRNTANWPRCCRVRAGLFLYTTAVIGDFLIILVNVLKGEGAANIPVGLVSLSH